MREMRKLTAILCVILGFILQSWGFYAHRLINKMACLSLPEELKITFRTHIQYLSDHAIDPDKRCYIDTLEPEKHYIDLEDLEGIKEQKIVSWSQANALWGLERMRKAGVIPWQINNSYYQLKKAFENENLARALKVAAELGHYIADSHVPLHTTKNYNGQLTNQRGIHALWETKIPEMFAESYNYFVGKAFYVENPLEMAWSIVHESHKLVDSVLKLEKELTESMSMDKKYAFVTRKGQINRNYSDSFVKKYHELLDGMVEKRLRQSILLTASFWYTAWIDAGSPKFEPTFDLMSSNDTLIIDMNTQKIKGRTEWH